MNNILRTLTKSQLTIVPRFFFHFPETKFPTANKSVNNFPLFIK